MKIILATDKEFAHVIISEEERKLIEEEVKKELPQRVHDIFSKIENNYKKNEKTF